MTERAVGIKTTGADTYVAAFLASEQADGQNRIIQIISLASGKFDATIGAATRSISSSDSLDVSGLLGDIVVGDNAYFACYAKHSRASGSCLVTPLLCDDDGVIVGKLESKKSQVQIALDDGSGHYLSNVLSWNILGTGAWKLYAHVADLSDSNSVDLWCFTF
jgi:hypothetical protein